MFKTNEKNAVECERVNIEWRKGITYIVSAHQEEMHGWEACS